MSAGSAAEVQPVAANSNTIATAKPVKRIRRLPLFSRLQRAGISGGSSYINLA